MRLLDSITFSQLLSKLDRILALVGRCRAAVKSRIFN
jgi:hypothetical protein